MALVNGSQVQDQLQNDVLFSSLTNEPHTFLQPTLPLHTDALSYLRDNLNPLAKTVSSLQQDRQREARKKRKRGERDSTNEQALRLKQVHTDGFGIDQIWEQSKRIIDAATIEAERGLDWYLQRQILVEAPSAEVESSEDESDIGEEGVDYEIEGEDDDPNAVYENSDMEDEDVDMDGVDDYGALEGDGFEMDEEELNGEGVGNDELAEEFIPDKHGLNDGFFSIDDFNRQSEFLEQQDARGDDDGAGSDEEDVDWDTNPLTAGAASTDTAASGQVEIVSEEDEDGPTFGDADAPSEDEGGDGDGELGGGDLDGMDDTNGLMGNTNNVLYADFFAPPAQKRKKNKKGRPNPHNFPASAPSGLTATERLNDEDMDRTMAAVHRDLFEDDDSEPDEEQDGNQEQVDEADPRSRRSAHEKRRAALAEEIRKLEAANLAKRSWTLSGEARAADRPMNSLLEEDLDFERAGKPVPVITAEVSESIEDLIKRRVLALDFQDIIRRRPDDLATGKEGRRGRLDFELDDSKSKKGLAEEYEEEYSKRTDPNYVDAKDEKTQKEEREIEALWKDVCGKLDSLSSWHFRPKAPAKNLEIRIDAPAITMEDARPSAGGEVSGASQLAPQEVYKAGEGTAKNSKDEVVGKSGLPAGREELSREDKKRRRRREKERIRKAGGNEPTRTESKKSRDKKDVLGDLRKGGVKVIGKKGQMQHVDGRDAREVTGGQGVSQYKL